MDQKEQGKKNTKNLEHSSSSDAAQNAVDVASSGRAPCHLLASPVNGVDIIEQKESLLARLFCCRPFKFGRYLECGSCPEWEIPRVEFCCASPSRQVYD